MFSKLLDAALSPIVDGLDFLEGLSEGELRTWAALRLGTDVVAGMTTAAIIQVLLDLDD